MRLSVHSYSLMLTDVVIATHAVGSPLNWLQDPFRCVRDRSQIALLQAYN